MEKARAKEQAKNLAFSKKGATQILTKASSTIAALQAMVGRPDIDLIALHWLFCGNVRINASMVAVLSVTAHRLLAT